MKNPLLISVLVACLLVSVNSYGQDNNTDASNVIKSAFDPESAEWQISWPGRVSQYDLVYNSPPIDAMQGIPLGNGDVGALMWCESSRIIIVMNKSDLWDDSRTGSPDSWSERDDYYTTLRHGGRIIIDFKFPIFETMYLSEFQARLSLSDATVLLQSESPFGKMNLKAFIDHESGLLCFDLGTDLKEDVPLDISLERFGSRIYSMWYTRVERDASLGLSGTNTFANTELIWLTQKLQEGTFSIGGEVLKSNDLTTTYQRKHARSSMISLNGNGKKEAQLVFAVTSPGMDPVKPLKKSLSQARENGIDSLYRTHTNIWKKIWNRSFMDYGDDYLNNLWHLTMYYANASQGGKYPGRFNNGIWGWSHDVQNWNFYFHWNQQQIYWPLNAAGHHDLMKPYLDFRFKSLPYAQMEAKKYFYTDGAYISDVTNRKGYNSPDIRHNHTPVAEIALDFWRQYQYTGDRIFLTEKALPFLLEAARFFDSCFMREKDSLYHAIEGSGYEGWIMLRDGLTELVYARALFQTVLEAVNIAGIQIPESEKWQELFDQLAPIPFVKAGNGLIDKVKSTYRINQGFFEGYIVPGDDIIAAGWGIDEKRWLTTHYPINDDWVATYSEEKGKGAFTESNKLAYLNGIFPAVPSSPVFPSGLIGLEKKNGHLFDVMETTVRLIGPEVMGWDPVPIVMARLGMSIELDLILKKFPERWQIYCNGWGHIGLEGKMRDEAVNYFRTNTVRDRNMPIETADRFPSPMWPFRHMSMESMSVLATAMNESIFQSYDGIFRIAPAFPLYKTGRFTLHAVGGFIVSSEIKSGKIQWISIRSKSGKLCRLQLPWKKALVHSNLTDGRYSVQGDVVEIQTKIGELLLITAEGTNPDAWINIAEMPEKNMDVKYHSSEKSQLGIPRMY